MEFDLSSLAQFLIAGAAIFTAIFIYSQLKTHNKQLALSNFDSITESMGDKSTKKARKVILYETEKLEIDNLVKELKRLDKDPKITTRKLEPKLDKLMGEATHLAARYDRIGYILTMDKNHKKDFLNYHGHVIRRLNEKLKMLVEFWAETNDYKYFRQLILDCNPKEKKWVDSRGQVYDD